MTDKSHDEPMCCVEKQTFTCTIKDRNKPRFDAYNVWRAVDRLADVTQFLFVVAVTHARRHVRAAVPVLPIGVVAVLLLPIAVHARNRTARLPQQIVGPHARQERELAATRAL